MLGEAYRSRDCNALFLAARQEITALSNLSLKLIGQVHDEVVGVGSLGSLFDEPQLDAILCLRIS
jgi:hypothetical protein